MGGLSAPSTAVRSVRLQPAFTGPPEGGHYGKLPADHVTVVKNGIGSTQFTARRKPDAGQTTTSGAASRGRAG